MTDKKLLNSLSRLGFPMFEPSESFDVNATLAEVVKSNDSRLWEGFPVMLANAAEEYRFALDSVKEQLPQAEHQKQFSKLLLLSLALYAVFHLSFPWANRLKKSLTSAEKDYVKKLRNALVHDADVTLNNTKFDAGRLKGTFELYFEQSGEKNRKRKERYEEYSLEYSLSQVFSPKQKELFKKKLDGLPFTKTEQEYYSRAVKKKVVALANPELHRLSQKLLE